MLETFEKQFNKALSSVGLSSAEFTLDSGTTEETETVDHELTSIERPAGVVKKLASINLFQHPEAHPIALDLALLRKYGPEWLTWETETLELRIPLDFKTNSLSEINLDKILTVKTLHIQDSFWTQWEVFSPLVNPLNNLFADFFAMQVPAYGEVVVAADIAGHIRTDVTWSDEVKIFIQTVMRHDGIVLGIEPLQDIVPDMTGFLIDVDAIRTRWPVVRQTDKIPSGDTFEDEQLRRLLAIHRYVEHRRQQLRDQLPLVLTI